MSDLDLTPDQLSEKYNSELGEGEHPVYTRWDWRQEVASGSTIRGYWDWVAAQIEEQE